jgi:hypothetical protein
MVVSGTRLSAQPIQRTSGHWPFVSCSKAFGFFSTERCAYSRLPAIMRSTGSKSKNQVRSAVSWRLIPGHGSLAGDRSGDRAGAGRRRCTGIRTSLRLRRRCPRFRVDTALFEYASTTWMCGMRRGEGDVHVPACPFILSVARRSRFVCDWSLSSLFFSFLSSRSRSVIITEGMKTSREAT